jgi:hypothetical protein
MRRRARRASVWRRRIQKKLVASFLRDDRFLLVSPNAYNILGVGTTQLHNTPVVYNHQRHGRFNLGGLSTTHRL